MQCLMSKTNFFACMLSMILVSNPPQNEYSEFFFFAGNSSYYYKSNSPYTPKKKGPNHSQLTTHYVGGKDQFLFFSNL